MVSNKQRLETFLSLFSRKRRILVIINADPDAIASAMAVKRLLARNVGKVVITYFNNIRRPDNIAMVRLLDSGIIPISDIDERAYDRIITVDSQPDHHECFGMFAYDAIIDHHPVTCDSARFNDIRPDYGACSTILTEYLKAAGIQPSQKLATALVLGIKTDTAEFSRQAGMEDVRAFQYLYRFANTHLIARIEQAELEVADLDVLAGAIRKKSIRNHRVFSHMGEIASPDQCVITADFFMKVVSVSWSVISGIVGDTLVIIIRNNGMGKSAGTVAKEAFGAVGSAGGHKSMARAEIKLKELDGRRNIGKWIIKRFEFHVGKR